MALILDTGPLYATLDRSDADDSSSRRLVENAGEPIVIPAPVLVEVDYWIHARLRSWSASASGSSPRSMSATSARFAPVTSTRCTSYRPTAFDLAPCCGATHSRLV